MALTKAMSVEWCRLLFCIKQKTAYEMRISDWSSDVCSSDLEMLATEILNPNGSSNPLGDDFDYAKAFKSLDYQALKDDLTALKIGRASCRESVCQYV